MTAALATVETLQHMTGRRFGCLLDFSMFVDTRGWCNPALATIAERGVERVSEDTVGRAMAFFAKLGLVSRQRDEITDSYDYEVDKHYLPALIEARRILRPDYRVRRQKSSLNRRPPFRKFAGKGITPLEHNPETFSPRARGEGVEDQGGDTSPASGDEARPAPASAPSGDEPRPGPIEPTAQTVSPARQSVSAFRPIGCRHREPHKEAQKWANRALKSAKIKRWLAATRNWEGQALFHNALAGTTLAGGPAPPTAEQLRVFDLAAQALDASGWNDIPEGWYARHGIKPPGGPPAPKAAPAAPGNPEPRSRAELYREALAATASAQNQVHIVSLGGGGERAPISLGAILAMRRARA